jgi:hypothetical protein
MSLHDRIPELASIDAALEQSGRGEPITSRCIHCAELIAVVRVPGAIHVGCPCNKTRARFRVAM